MGGQGGCEQRIEVIVKMQKVLKKTWGGEGQVQSGIGGGVEEWGLVEGSEGSCCGGQGGCEQRIEVTLYCENAKSKKKKAGGGG